ncbi:hypothetical protein [Apilactobacillus sp. EABW-1NA]|uniref:hypothetical protein n=1 Tax=Apilactobacillus sp. EABW-1NA TaxID=2984137 RepID=UPI0025B08356|nr:hypothetical protein [Apilactobacillus sp. EABW-1NA]MDN2612976.1 hypothetical protein [Apilactobacillus sp. EABW-1NA]
MQINNEIFLKIINRFGGNGITPSEYIDFKIPKKNDYNHYYYKDESGNLNLLIIGKNIFSPYDDNLKTFASKNNINDNDINEFNDKYGVELKDDEDLSIVKYKNVYDIQPYKKSDIQWLEGKGIADYAFENDSYIVKHAELMVDDKILSIQLNFGNWVAISRQVPRTQINGYDATTIRALSVFYGKNVATDIVIYNKDKYLVFTETELRNNANDHESELKDIVFNLYGDHDKYENKEIIKYKNDYYIVVTKYTK